MKWKKVSEHPLPDGDHNKYYILKIDRNFAHDYIYELCKHPAARHKDKGYTAHLVEWCEFNPDEIESGEISLGQVCADMTKDIERSQWEDEFRWKAAADMFCTFQLATLLNKSRPLPESDAEYSVQYVEYLIEKLKRGKE